MLDGLRGYNVPYLTWKTAHQTRGLFSYPSILRVVRADPASELDYDGFFERLAGAGVNWLRIKLTGRQLRWRENMLAFGLEPAPAGTFNVWHSALDVVDLGRYRSEQVRAPVDEVVLDASNLRQAARAAKRYGVTFHVVPFEHSEFIAGWAYHAWNAEGMYPSGQPFAAEDRGFLTDVRELFTDPTAKAAAKARLDFIIDVLGPEAVITSWELFAEMTWVLKPEWWGEDTWNDRMTDHVRGEVVPWVEEMASYIKSRHAAPVGNGQVFTGRLIEFPDNPNHQRNVRNEVYNTPSLDFVMINWYQAGDLERCHRWLRNCQAHFPGTQVLVEQYSPWDPSRDVPYAEESAPFQQSKAHEWLLACGEYGAMGPLRWPGIEEEKINWWRTGGYADAGMMEIAGVTARFADAVDVGDWSRRGESWDEQVSAEGLGLTSTWGDGRHVTMMLQFGEVVAEVVEVTVQGMEAGLYELVLYDWLTGEALGTQRLAVLSEGEAVFWAEPVDGVLVGYLAPEARPEAPMLLEPEDGALIEAEAVTFRWSDVGAVEYELRVGSDVILTPGLEQTVELLPGVYGWSVQARDEAGLASEAGDTRMVTVEAVRPPVVVVVQDAEMGEVGRFELEQGRSYTLVVGSDI